VMLLEHRFPAANFTFPVHVPSPSFRKVTIRDIIGQKKELRH
jgi:hypothetical protein